MFPVSETLGDWLRVVASDALVVLSVEERRVRADSAAEFLIAWLMAEAVSFGTIGAPLRSRLCLVLGDSVRHVE